MESIYFWPRDRNSNGKTCLLELSSEDKELIMEICSNLRGIQKRIFIKEDPTNVEFGMRRVIRKKAQEDTANGRDKQQMLEEVVSKI